MELSAEDEGWGGGWASLGRDDHALVLLGEEVGHLVGGEQLVELLDALVVLELGACGEHVVVLAVGVLTEDELVVAEPGGQREGGGDDRGVLVAHGLGGRKSTRLNS